MNNFIFNIPTKIYFGKKQMDHLHTIVHDLGHRVLLVYGGGSIKANGIYDEVSKQLKDCEVYELANVNPNPRIESVREGVRLCKEHDIEVILAVGGGSCIDCSKAIAASAFSEKDAWEIVLDASKVEKALPIVSVLTLSATGSEMNSSGVISNLKENLKLGFSNPLLYPKVSILDPENTYTVPARQTAAGTADILSHLFEIYFNETQGAFVQEELAHSLMKTCLKYGPIALNEPTNYEARANLMWAATLSLNGLVASGFGKSWSTHPMEHVLSAYYDITHGVGLAILTPSWMRYILDETTLSRFKLFAIEVMKVDPTLDDLTIANEGINRLEKFFAESLKLPAKLSEVGIDESQFAQMAQSAVDSKGGFINGFKRLEKEDVVNIYKMCA
ncbi:MAG: iron-containing alcohol dehydrogenase [Erysipelotrichia bacterium]|nr:iron-containing alcohol dehydrogenase [Erysipelotrichia bacterium]NCC54259.1 iron-containing alcohol dehydrogenase [Erysipelotrichia bacterium]